MAKEVKNTGHDRKKQHELTRTKGDEDDLNTGAGEHS